MDNANDHEQSSNGDAVNTIINNYLDITEYEFSFCYKPIKNPANLLANLAPLKNDVTLSNDEKIKEVRRIVMKFME